MTRAGFPHSDTPGSQLGCQLPRAYRRLLRPSSALDAKASTMCPSQLVSQTLNKDNNYKDQASLVLERHLIIAAGMVTDREDARVHYPVHKVRAHQRPAPAYRRLAKGARVARWELSRRASGLIPQGPTVCQFLLASGHSRFHSQELKELLGCTGECRRPARRFVDDSTSEHHQCHPDGCWMCGVCAP